jgi:diphthamide synthase (EF-2-diphthine--ammonia ligase)
MHAVRRELVAAQAAAAGLPLWAVELPWPCANEDYERLMSEACARARAQGVTHVAFGDLYLADVRAYRERQMAGTGLEPLFPLWAGPEATAALARRMLAAGLRATLTCVDTRQLAGDFAGREFDEALLAELPTGIDPCGERGEFHTFCWAGPMFERPIAVRAGPIVEREGFRFADLLPAGEPLSAS